MGVSELHAHILEEQVDQVVDCDLGTGLDGQRNLDAQGEEWNDPKNPVVKRISLSV